MTKRFRVTGEVPPTSGSKLKKDTVIVPPAGNAVTLCALKTWVETATEEAAVPVFMVLSSRYVLPAESVALRVGPPFITEEMTIELPAGVECVAVIEIEVTPLAADTDKITGFPILLTTDGAGPEGAYGVNW